MRFELQSIGVWTVVKVSFFFNLVAGFLFGLLFAPFLGAFVAALMSGPLMDSVEVDPTGLSVGTMFVVVPLVFAVFSALFGTLFVAALTIVYNLVATFVGGLEFDFSEVMAAEGEEAPEVPMADAVATPVGKPLAGPRSDTPPPPPPFGGSSRSSEPSMSQASPSSATDDGPSKFQ